MKTLFRIIWGTIKMLIFFALVDVVLFFTLAILLSMSKAGMDLVPRISEFLNEYSTIVLLVEGIVSLLLGLIFKNRLPVMPIFGLFFKLLIGVVILNAVLVFALPQIVESNPIIILLIEAVLLVVIPAIRGFVSDLQTGRTTGGGDPDDLLIMGSGIYKRSDLDKKD